MSGRPCIFGEVLFDLFPDGRRVLGGAPFNVAWNLKALGEDPVFVSRVGTDTNGLSVRSAMQDWGMSQEYLQLGASEHTGEVRVRIKDGEPHYDIVHPVAWDVIEPPEPVPRAALLYHGSLALRSPQSREAFETLRAARPGTVFLDVNLRDPWWDETAVVKMLHGADWAKFNEFEFDRLAPGGDSTESRAQAAIGRFGLHALLLTAGERGAFLFTRDGEAFRTEPAGAVEIVDTVGAGDAFAAVTILGILRGWPYQSCLDRAQAFASALLGQRGATVHDPAFYAAFTSAWSKH